MFKFDLKQIVSASDGASLVVVSRRDYSDGENTYYVHFLQLPDDDLPPDSERSCTYAESDLTAVENDGCAVYAESAEDLPENAIVEGE